MSTISPESRNKTFAALKLIEMLFVNKEIPEQVYRRIILKYAEPDQLVSFYGFREDRKRGKGGASECNTECME